MIQVLPSVTQTTTAEAQAIGSAGQLSFTFTPAGPTVCGGCGAKLTCGCGCNAALPHRCPSVHAQPPYYLAPLPVPAPWHQQPWWAQPLPYVEPKWQWLPNQTICTSDYVTNPGLGTVTVQNSYGTA